MAAENLGELEAGVKLVPETEAAEKAIADFSAKTKRQLESIGGQTLTQLTQNFDGLTNAVTGGLDAINSGIAKIRNVASLGFLGGGVAGIVNQIFQTRSYFQDAASSMKTFLGDADKAAKFTKELQEYAFYNMYEFQDLVGVSKQLIAYGTTDTKEIIQVTDQLSNIATGTGANINEMVYIYNKIKAQGKLQGDELNQLASRGLVVKDVLKEMGETVNGNNVTFEQFQKVLTHVTSEGGMFHDLMKDQLNNLSASAAQLSDVLSNMWNEIGEAAEPYMKEAIDLASMVVENYQEIAAVLFDIAKAYGVYKVVASGADWVKNTAHEERIKQIEREKEALDEALESTKALKNEDLDKEVKENKLTSQNRDEIVNLREQVNAENELRIKKGEVTEEQAKQLAVVKEGLLRREQELRKVKEVAAEEIKEIDKQIAAIDKKHAAQEKEVDVAKSFGADGKDILEAEQKKLNTLETQRQELASKKVAAQKRIEAAATQENTIATARETAEKSKNSQVSGVFGRAMTAAGSAIKGIGSSIVSMINPVGLLVTALGFLAQKMYEVYKAGTLSEQAENRLREAQEEASKETVEQMQNLAQYATTIKNLSQPAEEYAKKLKTLKEGTEEYNKTAEQAKIVNAQLGDAKKGLNEMTKKYQISTKETVNGIEQEMSAVDLVTKKYDEYKQKIQEVANFKAYTNFVENEKKRMQETVTEFTSYLREDMVDVLLRGIKGEERGKKLAEIKAAISEYEISLIETGRAPLSGAFKQFYDEYLDKIKALDSEFSVAGLMNAGKGFKRLGRDFLKSWSGDMSFEDYLKTLHAGGGDYIQEYITSWAQNVEEELGVGYSAISNAQKYFVQTTDPLAAAEEEEKKKNANRYKTKIQNDKSVQANYIKEYAKLAEERYKALKKIDAQFTLTDEEKEYKKQKVDASFDFKLGKLDTSKLQEGEANQLNDLYNNALTAANDMAVADAEKELNRLREQISAIQKERETILNTEKLTDEKGNNLTGEDKKKFKDAQTAKANEKSAEIAKLTAQMLAYENVVQRSIDAEINFSRIHAITKQENEKFLDGQVKKQQQIAENYKKLRQELQFMFDDKQLTKEQYDKMSFQLDLNEEQERRQEYINIYGGYYQKREELTRQWEQRLANVPPEYFNVAKQKMVEELSKMNFDQFKQNLNWDAIFGDLSHQSARAIKENIDSLKAAFEAEKGNMGIDEIKTVTEALTKLDEELNKRNPWRAMVQSIKAMKAAAKELPQLTEKHTQAQKDLNEATAEYKRISEELEKLQQQLSNPDLSDEQRAEIQTEINKKLKEQGKALANVTEKEKEAAQAQKALNDEQDKASKAPNDWIQGWQDVSKGIADAGNALAQFDGKLGEIGSVLANIGSELQNAFSSIKSGDMFSIISTAVTSIVGIVSTISNSRKKARQEEKEWALAQQRFADNMQLAEVQSTRLATKNKENIFGVRDYMGEAQDAVDAYKLAQKKLSEQIDKLDKEGKAKKGQRDGVDWGAVGKTTGKGAAAGAAIGTAIGGWALGLGTVIGGAIGAVGGFFSGLFGGKKKKTQWGGLLEQYPELVERAADGEERINMELAEQLIQQGIVNDETKEMLETAKGYQEEMDAANEQISSIVSDLTGSLGQNLKNALVDAFVAGEDAAETFKKSVDTMLEDMIADLMFTAAFSDLFDELGEKYKAIFKGGGTIEDIVNATNEFMDEGAARSQLYVDGLAAVQKAANENGGHNLWQSAQERNAVAGGIANVTQDTAEEMNGRLTQIQSHTFSINENMKLMVNMQTTQLAILQGIHTDTGQLHAIRADIASVKATVADIQIRGLKLKE